MNTAKSALDRTRDQVEEALRILDVSNTGRAI